MFLINSLKNTLDNLINASSNLIIDSHIKKAYLSRFSLPGAIFLYQKEIPPELALTYPSKYVCWEISDLIENNVSAETLEAYPSRFGCYDIINLIKSNISPEISSTYPSDFSVDLIAFFHNNSGSPEIAKEYVKGKFGAELLNTLKNNLGNLNTQKVSIRELISKCSSDVEKVFLEHLSRRRIPDDCFRRFDFIDLLMFSFDQGDSPNKILSWEKAKSYSKELGGVIISMMYNNNVSPEDASLIYARFGKLGLFILSDSKVPLNVAMKYNPNLSSISIACLYSAGLTPNVMDDETQKRFGSILDHFFRFTIFYDISSSLKNSLKNPDHNQGLLENYAFIGAGTSALIVYKKISEEEFALKVSSVSNEEEEIIKKIVKANELKGMPVDYVIKPKSTKPKYLQFFMNVFKIPNFIELEYIKGKNLYQRLDIEKEILNSVQTIKYSSDISNGLLELRNANVYHRDLWLGNIMIDEVKDRAVIIDLGIATDNPEEGPKDNRRYGGENDLQSLGQIMYKMVTGHHLFNPSICMSTHLIPDAVKAERERVYADSASLERRLKQVKENVPNKKVAGIIQMCLTAKGSDEDYKMLEERFKEYV